MKILQKIILIITVFTIKNSLAQSPCFNNDKDSSNFFLISEIMPTLRTSIKLLETKLDSAIILNDYNINDGEKFNVVLLVNCKGESLDYKVHKSDNNLFNSKLTEILKRYCEWTPGFVKKNAVNVYYTLKFEVINRKIKMNFNEKYNEQNRKEFEKLKKKTN